MTVEIWTCDRPEWFVCSGWAKNDSWTYRRRCRRRGMAGTWGGGAGWRDMGTFEPKGTSGIKSRQGAEKNSVVFHSFSLPVWCIWWTCVTLLVETEPLNVLLAGKHCTSCCASCCTGVYICCCAVDLSCFWLFGREWHSSSMEWANLEKLMRKKSPADFRSGMLHAAFACYRRRSNNLKNKWRNCGHWWLPKPRQRSVCWLKDCAGAKVGDVEGYLAPAFSWKFLHVFSNVSSIF